MTEGEILKLLRSEAGALSNAWVAHESKISVHGVYSFVHGVNGAQLRTVVNIAEAIGYELVLVRKVRLPVPQVVRPVMHRSAEYPIQQYKKKQPENEFACLKCGRDAGVVSVSGHTQCANCGHIIQDCCGD